MEPKASERVASYNAELGQAFPEEEAGSLGNTTEGRALVCDLGTQGF